MSFSFSIPSYTANQFSGTSIFLNKFFPSYKYLLLPTNSSFPSTLYNAGIPYRNFASLFSRKSFQPAAATATAGEVLLLGIEEVCGEMRSPVI